MLKTFIPKISYNVRNYLPILSTTFATQIRKPEIYYNRAYSSTSTSITQITKRHEESFLSKILKKFGWMDVNKARRKVTAYLMYETVVDKIDYEYFFEECKMPDSFNSWFLVTELHVWMLLVRAMAEGSEKGSTGRDFRNNIVEALWADVATRTKQLRDVNSYGVRKQIQVLSEQFQYALIGYDEGLGSNDMTLAGAIWRRLLEQNCDDAELLERLVIYVRKQISQLDEIPGEVFLQKRDLEWTSLKDTL